MPVAAWPLVLNRTGILIGLLCGACSSNDNVSGDCAITHEQKTITTTEPAADLGLQFKIDSCRADADACPTLCALAMTRAGITFNNGFVGQPGGNLDTTGAPLPPNGGGGGFNAPVNPAITCDVTFQSGTVEMRVAYDVFQSTLGCPIQINDSPTTGIPTPTTGGPK